MTIPAGIGDMPTTTCWVLASPGQQRHSHCLGLQQVERLRGGVLKRMG